MTLITRAYQSDDWLEASRIHDLARPIELMGSCDPRAFVPLADDKQDLAEFESCRKLVGCLGHQLAGFVGISDSEIGWLYVDPAFARQGIGRRLLRAGLEHITGPASVYVLSGNAPALGLYQSEGFREVDRFRSKNHGYPCTVLKLTQSG